MFPAPHQTGGLATGAFAPYTAKTRVGAIEEFPITAVRVFGKPMCFFGGGYLRLFPYSVIRAMGCRALGEGRPVIFYVHPREIDPAQPRMALSRRRSFTCYVNLETTRPKIRRILRGFRSPPRPLHVTEDSAVNDRTSEFSTDMRSISIRSTATTTGRWNASPTGCFATPCWCAIRRRSPAASRPPAAA